MDDGDDADDDDDRNGVDGIEQKQKKSSAILFSPEWHFIRLNELPPT